MELKQNDTIATKDGKILRVLSIYKSGNDITRIEGIDDASDIPCRKTVYVNNILRVLPRKKQETVETGKEGK